MSLFEQLKQRKVFRVGAAYLVAAWLVMQVSDTLAPALRLPEWVHSAVVFVLIIGLPVALLLAWAFEVTPAGIRRDTVAERPAGSIDRGRSLDFIIIGVLVIAVGYFVADKFWFDRGEPAVPAAVAGTAGNAIAVLPFVNMSDDRGNEFFADGITEELLNLLSRIPELRVTSRTSAFTFKNRQVDIPTVARELGVDYVLEGSVRKSGSQIRITAQLIKADEDRHLWSDTYSRELDDVFAIQDEIAATVVGELHLQLVGDVPVAARANSEAYTLYLEGLHHLEMGLWVPGPEASQAFEKSLVIDPGYAPAWHGLARALAAGAQPGDPDFADRISAANDALDQSLELDPSIAEAHATRALIQLLLEWQWDDALASVNRALRIDPRNAYALRMAAIVSFAFGKQDDAMDYLQRSLLIDPLNPTLLRQLALTYLGSGTPEKGERYARRLIELYPDIPGSHGILASLLAAQGNREEALAQLEQETDGIGALLASAGTYNWLGQGDRAEQELQKFIEVGGVPFAFQIAELYAVRGERDRAFEWLDIAYLHRDAGLATMLGDPRLGSLHADPRWIALVEKMNLLDPWSEMQHRDDRP